MKYELPSEHGLSATAIDTLVFMQGEQPSLTDAQYAALNAGVGRGESLLVASPTSTGKTQIALWAIASSLEAGCRTVYLVNYKALAKQKLQDFSAQLGSNFLDGDLESLVLATGDSVENAKGNVPSDPLAAPLLVATYEKYLALLTASGVPTDMGSTVIVCDEIQLLGDKSRGQNVEVLLAVLKNAGWRQFVGLSAVLQPTDAKDLAHWLGVSLVAEHTREKHLHFECWSPDGIASARSDVPDSISEGDRLPPGADVSVLGALRALKSDQTPRMPIIVFCMRKRDTYILAEAYCPAPPAGNPGQLSLAFDGLPETAANSLLSRLIEQRVAFHNADLTEEEREIVENRLLGGKIDIVFATSTLAAGVNFPFGAAVFERWTRWNFERREHEPIGVDEFHNMAGRVGRMGFEHEHGRVIFFAQNKNQARIAARYLQLNDLPRLEPRVSADRFEQFALQLVGSGICTSRDSLEQLVLSTFSALREQDRNLASFEQWPEHLAAAIDRLAEQGFVVETAAGKLVATPVGKALGQSGLLPATCIVLLDYLASKAQKLAGLLPAAGSSGDMNRLALLLYSACFSSPEFQGSDGIERTRFLPWPLDKASIFDPTEFAGDLLEPVWRADFPPINAAWLCTDWSEGAVIRDLERSLPNLTAGMLRDIEQHLVWVLQGISAIVAAATDSRVPEAMRPSVIRNQPDCFRPLSLLPRVMRRLSLRVARGLPDDALWMAGLNDPDSEYRLSRTEILKLRSKGFGSPERLVLSSPDANDARVEVFENAKPSAHAKANWLRDHCREWKTRQRLRTSERHLERANRLGFGEQLSAYYAAMGTDFEAAFETLLDHLGIGYDKIDTKEKTGAPDYLVRLGDSPPLVFELKSKKTKLVGYNDATEVLSASEMHGHKELSCVTLCHPGVDPAVPMEIISCGRLSVVESADLAEALIRLKASKLSESQLWHWLSSPGQALIADLPYVDHALS